MAAKDDMLLMPQLFSRMQIELLKTMIPEDDAALQAEYEHQYLRCGLLEMEKHLDTSFDIEETYRYEAIWATLFQLKFSSAKGLIESWSPEKTFDKARQLILKEFIGIDTGKQYKSMLRSDDYINKMDYIYVRHMLRTIKGESACRADSP
jgi:hypothetical protein